MIEDWVIELALRETGQLPVDGWELIRQQVLDSLTTPVEPSAD